MKQVIFLKGLKYFLAVVLIFLLGFYFGYEHNRKNNNTEQIDMYINIIIPKNKEELNKQILFNIAQKSVLDELKKMDFYKKEK